jgi:SAM-dependent methyltransferase
VATGAWAQTEQTFRPEVGQAGKDVVWVPTPEELVEKMLDLAQVTPQDLVMDLGSGDGRNIIAAAKRGARAVGVEYNPDMVEVSRRAAAAAGVSDRATFVEGDMFEADISKANVLALFLLPSNMLRLSPKFLGLKPGSRIVANTFGIQGWEPDATERIAGACGSWCTALLWYVPAQVDGTWRLPEGELQLKQEFQRIEGTLSTNGSALPVENGKLRGDQISFVAGGATYTGRVSGDAMEGVVQTTGTQQNWRASRSGR